jgi:hypothetical protein
MGAETQNVCGRGGGIATIWSRRFFLVLFFFLSGDENPPSCEKPAIDAVGVDGHTTHRIRYAASFSKLEKGRVQLAKVSPECVNHASASGHPSRVNANTTTGCNGEVCESVSE